MLLKALCQVHRMLIVASLATHSNGGFQVKRQIRIVLYRENLLARDGASVTQFAVQTLINSSRRATSFSLV